MRTSINDRSTMTSFLTADSEDDEDGDEDENDETNIIHNYQHNLTIYKKNERVIIEIEEVTYYDENQCVNNVFHGTTLRAIYRSNNDDPTSEQININMMMGARVRTSSPVFLY